MMIADWLVYTRGTTEDFNRVASVTGDSGWGWNSILPYFKKSEQWTAPADNHNTAGQFNPAVHGTSGVVGVSLSGFPTGINSKVITATGQLQGNFKFNLDMNSGSELGVGECYFGNQIECVLMRTLKVGPNRLSRVVQEAALQPLIWRLSSCRVPTFTLPSIHEYLVCFKLARPCLFSVALSSVNETEVCSALHFANWC
jgi:hypothetical protein